MSGGPVDEPELDRPEVVAAVREAFERYERALADGDLATMRASFVESSDVVRFGIADEQVGSRELEEWRALQPPIPAGRTLSETKITTFGTGTATVTTVFAYPGRPLRGRQSQVWIRFPDGWKVVHAHVSEVPVIGH